ncbi:MAG: hypothetical protein ACO1NV_01695 [Leptospira bouyouniensis]
MKNLPLYLLILLLFSFCKKADWREQMEAENQKVILQIAIDHQQIKNNLAKNRDWSQSSKTKNLAIQNFLNEILKFNEPKNFFVSWDEKMEVIFPNILGTGTMLDTTPLVEYKKVLENRESIAIIEINRRLQGKKFKLLSIDWEKPRNYGLIKGHKPKSLKILIDNNPIAIDQIKMVFETESGFKVGVIGP